MKTTIKIKVQIPSPRGSINLPEPCTYCGKPVDASGEYQKHFNIIYTLMKWGVGRKLGNMQLWEVSRNGVTQRGNVKVNVPYCPEHINKVKLIPNIRMVCVLFFVVAALLFDFFVLMPRTGLSGEFLYVIIFFGLSLFFGVAIGLLFYVITIGMLINLFFHEYRMYPILGRGHWGLTIDDVKTDGGEFGIGPVTYSLWLNFTNIESAKRFLAKYPGAQIIKGADLV